MYFSFLKRMSPYMIKKGFLYLRHFGLKEFWIRLQERLEPEEVPYGPWYEKYRPGEKTLEEQRRRRFRNPPCFSICVPVYHPPKPFLEAMVQSVIAQTYGGWELCLVQADPQDQEGIELLSSYVKEDSRIHLQVLGENLGIAGNTNAAIRMATGDWVCLLDHDDLLAPEALATIAEALEAHPEARLVYTDEDKVRPIEGEGGLEHFQPHLKPDFNLDLLRSNNYFCHFFLVRRELSLLDGGLSPSFDGAQDYDYFLRLVEAALQEDTVRGSEGTGGRQKSIFQRKPQEGKVILHVPQILYHWRVHAASTADNPASKKYAYDAGQRAIEGHLARMGVQGSVMQLPDLGFYRVLYPVQGSPLVSIIIPTKDNLPLLKTCLKGLAENTSYQNFEVLLVENNSVQPETFAFYRQIEEKGVPGGKTSKEEAAIPYPFPIRILRYPGSFNFSAINNFAARQALGDYLVFLNNDIEIETNSWLEEMLGVCQRPEVGACGAKLSYPDHTIQHAGVVVGMGGIAGAMFVGMADKRSGYLHKASLLQDMSAVTAACMMVPKEAFWEADGFTEELAVAFNDIDLCLKLRSLGYLVVYDPYVWHIHAESKTRGPEDTPEKARRFQGEIEYMRSHWTAILKEGDPMYNPHLSLSKWNYSLRPWQGK